MLHESKQTSTYILHYKLISKWSHVLVIMVSAIVISG